MPAVHILSLNILHSLHSYSLYNQVSLQVPAGSPVLLHQLTMYRVFLQLHTYLLLSRSVSQSLIQALIITNHYTTGQLLTDRIILRSPKILLILQSFFILSLEAYQFNLCYLTADYLCMLISLTPWRNRHEWRS